MYVILYIILCVGIYAIISNFNGIIGYYKKSVSVYILKKEGLFEDNDNYCNGSITVNVICGKEKADGSIVEDYEAIVPEGTCGN